jgi:hypothetical protein
MRFKLCAQHLCWAVCRLYAVTTRECRRCRTGRAGQCWLSVVLRALTRVSLSRRDAAAAAPWPLAPLCATAACRGSHVATVVVLRARPGSARRHVHVLAGRPVYCAHLSPLASVFVWRVPPCARVVLLQFGSNVAADLSSFPCRLVCQSALVGCRRWSRLGHLLLAQCSTA